MMSVLEYAEDVNKTVEAILKKCKELNIKVNAKDDMLSEDDIVMLDNLLDEIEDIEELEEEERLVVESEKSKPKKVKKVEIKTNKKDFLNKKKEYAYGITINTAMMKNNSILESRNPLAIIARPQKINSLELTRCVRFQFSSLDSVHGIRMPAL